MTRLRLAVVGDSMIDRWVHGRLESCQDGCMKFVETGVVKTPGGAANAANCLLHQDVDVKLIDGPVVPIKKRFVDESGHTIFRHDVDFPWIKYDPSTFRRQALHVIRHDPLDGVLISDYAKGFLDDVTINEIVHLCNDRDIPCVADLKREPTCALGAVLKCNAAYSSLYLEQLTSHYPAVVITQGHGHPTVFSDRGTEDMGLWDEGLVVCRNHVGAGDCFGAHLLLRLAGGDPLPEAARYAHAAGRVYVQHPHNRPPWPHEIARDLDPVGGKVLNAAGLRALRESNPDRAVVFTNGVFRIPHAGHAWLMDWAKKQGDILVVGINDDASAARLRPGEYCLPLEERVQMLAGMAAVDWICAFPEDDPCGIISAVRPNLLVKGVEYTGQRVPGDDLVPEVRFSPESPFDRHCADLVMAIRG